MGEEKDVKTSAKTKKRRKTSADYAIEFFIKIAVTAALIACLCIFVVGIHVNHGNASYPMLKDGDLVITYKFGKLNTGDEICYKTADGVRFGRVVAHGGDEVSISDSYVMVNGFGLAGDVLYPTTLEGACVEFPYTVQEGSVFVMNDYRKDIKDSRTYGAIPLEDCEGKVILVMRRRGI